jgi:hypothetical protein
MHVNLQVDLNRQDEECDGISTSNVGSASRPLDSSHAAENKEVVEQIEHHDYMEGACCACIYVGQSQEELFFQTYKSS